MHEYIYKTYFWNKTQTHSTVWHILLYNYKTRHSDVRPQLLTANSHLTVYDNDMNTLKSSFWKTHSVISYFVFWPNNCTCSTTFSMHANGCICNWLYSRALGFGVCLQWWWWSIGEDLGFDWLQDLYWQQNKWWHLCMHQSAVDSLWSPHNHQQSVDSVMIYYDVNKETNWLLFCITEIKVLGHFIAQFNTLT